MLWFKRILCGIYALFMIIWGISLINNSNAFWFILGCVVFIIGLILVHIAIRQRLPSYSFWMTFVAICLAYALLVQNNFMPTKKVLRVTSNNKTVIQTTKATKNVSQKKKKQGFNLSAYPKISGSLNVIHAHIYYVGGRYVRLYGVDAPDNDQLCSDINGSSYNCGEVAVSWVRNFVDKNTVDCYLLKIDPKGQDLATCIWGKYDIGAALVSAGWGIANMQETNIYKPYEIQARNSLSGLWQGSFYTPKEWREIKRRKVEYSSGENSFSFGSLFK